MRTITTRKLSKEGTNTMRAMEFDFKNKDYNVGEVVEKCRVNPRYALWVTNNMSTYEIAKMFIKEWDVAMEEKRREKSKA